MKDTFLDLLKSSVIMQGLLSLLVVGAYVYMLIAGLTIPETLTVSVGLVLGFFFGSKLALTSSASEGE